jgi:hypothetical protein
VTTLVLAAYSRAEDASASGSAEPRGFRALCALGELADLARDLGPRGGLVPEEWLDVCSASSRVGRRTEHRPSR